MLKDKTARLQILQQIDRIQDTQCKPCKHNRQTAAWCRDNCEFGRQLQKYGLMLGDKEVQRKVEATKKKTITHQMYRDLKATGKADAEIAEEFGIAQATLSYHKKKWKDVGKPKTEKHEQLTQGAPGHDAPD